MIYFFLIVGFAYVVACLSDIWELLKEIRDILRNMSNPSNNSTKEPPCRN